MWTLQAEGQPAQTLSPDVTHIALLGGILSIVKDLGDLHELGRITVSSSGAKLEAVQSALSVLPGHRTAATSDPRTTPYELQPRDEERSEAILLRHGDVISVRDVPGSLACAWKEPEVQVNSSAAENGIKAVDGVAETPGDETEDEDLDDVDNTMTAVEATQLKSQPEATPQMSNQRSVIVQETPITARTDGVPNHKGPTDMITPEPEEAPEQEQEPELEPFSTAHTRNSPSGSTAPEVADTFAGGGVMEDKPQTTRHPQVRIAKKRPSPSTDDQSSDPELPSRTRKRVKKSDPVEDDTQHSRLSNIAVEEPPPIPEVKLKTTAKNGKRKLAVAKMDAAEYQETPSRSQRSQRSTSAATSQPYQGDTPCVATSNSAIKDNGQGAKFLRKQGGKLVESVKDSFNVLCVRDGDLHKTPKVLQAIATGTPIVTDKWLTDSAKAGHFLAVDAYRPSAPAKEKEWNFKLQDVAGQPQTPFEGYTLHFTSALSSFYKPFTGIEQVCKAAGARVTTKKMGKKTDKIIVLAMDGDSEAEKLMADGVTCYNRDLLPMSIFRGALDLESDEFKIVESAKKETKKARGKKG